MAFMKNTFYKQNSLNRLCRKFSSICIYKNPTFAIHLDRETSSIDSIIGILEVYSLFKQRCLRKLLFPQLNHSYFNVHKIVKTTFTVYKINNDFYVP